MVRLMQFTLIAFALIIACSAVMADGVETLAKQGGQGVALFEAADVQPYNVPLTPIFEAAAAKYDVPVELLETLAYFGSAFENRGTTPNRDGGYGLTALRDNILGGESLNEAAVLTGIAKISLMLDPAANIEGTAAALDAYAKGVDRAAGLEAWLGPVIKYAGFDEEDSKFFAYEVFDLLQTGLDFINNEGEQFKFGPQDIGSIDLASLLPKSAKAVKSGGMGAFSSDVSAMSSDYGPATWDPAASCNYSTATHSSDTVVVHTMEGTLAGTTSWFKNCNRGTIGPSSSHYGIGTNGAVVQYVLEAQTAWHAGCYNSRSIGLEHEGYASQSSHPTALYDASAALTREICNERGIPKAHTSCGPGICGHLDVNNCACGPGHTDPGNGWNWSYFIGKVNGSTGSKPRPCVGNNADGRLEVFARGRNGHMYTACILTGGGWSSWIDMGGSLKGDPCVGRNQDGRMECFCVGTDGALYHAWQTSANGSWSGWSSLGGNWPGNPTVAANSDGRLEVFLRGTTNNIYHKWQTAPNGGWSANWEAMDANTFCKNDPVAIVDNTGMIHVFAIGTGGTMLWNREHPGWSGWSGLGGTWNYNPAVARNQNGKLEVFAIGTDGQMNHKWQTTAGPDGAWAGSWSYSDLSGNWQHSPYAFPDQNGALQVFCVGTTGNLYTKYQTAPNSGWSTTWANLGGTWSGDPGIGMNPDGRDEIFMVGNDPYMYHCWESTANGAYGGWATLGPNTIF